MNVLMITARADYGGGPEHINQILGASHDGIVFYMVCPNEYPYYERFRANISSPIFDIPHRKFDIICVIKLLRYVKNCRINIIHSHGRGAGIYSRILSILTQLPVIHTFHGFNLDNKPLFSKMLLKCSESLLSKLTSHFVINSESEKTMCELGGIDIKNKHTVINNGVIIPSFKVKKTGRKLTLISVSRLSKEKGVDLLLEIARKLSFKIDNFSLVVVGDGPCRKEYEAFVKENNMQEVVEFLGFRNDIYSLLNNTDIFVSASRGESFGLAVAEAMANSIPVVVSNVVGHCSIVKNEVTGYLFDIDNLDQAVQQIVNLYTDHRKYEQVSYSGYHYAKENFSIEAMCSKLFEVYAQYS